MYSFSCLDHTMQHRITSPDTPVLDPGTKECVQYRTLTAGRAYRASIFLGKLLCVLATRLGCRCFMRLIPRRRRLRDLAEGSAALRERGGGCAYLHTLTCLGKIWGLRCVVCVTTVMFCDINVVCHHCCVFCLCQLQQSPPLIASSRNMWSYLDRFDPHSKRPNCGRRIT